MLTIHHLRVSQSDRIIWLCEELGLEYRLVLYDREPADGRAPPEYRALYPFGLAPVITDGDVTLGESGAIVEYILERYGEGRLRPAVGDADFPAYLYWFHFANASLQPSAMVSYVLDEAGSGHGGKLAALRERFDHAYACIEAHLAQSDYFAGAEFSAADIMMVFNLTTLRTLIARDLADCPAIRRYLARIAQRPAFIAARRKDDPSPPPVAG